MSEQATTVELIDRAEVRDGQAIVTYSRTEAALGDLRKKYQGATYDLTTTAGDKAARAARLELVTLRTGLEKKRKELKAPAVEFGRKIDSEAARLTAEIQALETPIDTQIKADEKRRDDERRARDEAEAARKKVHTDAIARIAKYVELAADLPSEHIANGIKQLEGFDLSGFEEYTAEATETRDRTVAALRVLHIKAKTREDEEARLQAERAEQARIAAEQAETARKLKAQQEELDRQRAELEAARKAEERPPAEEQQRPQAEVPVENTVGVQTESGVQVAIKAPAVIAPPTSAPAVAPSVPTLNLGQINERLHPISIDDAGLTALGFPPAATEKNAKLRHEHDFSRICAALVAHIQAVHLKQAA